MAVSALFFPGALLVRAAEHDAAHAQAWTSVKQAVAVLHPTAGNKCQGKVTFTQEGEKVKVVAHIEGLNPGQKHAIHIHQYGDCSAPDGMSAGGHYIPKITPTACPIQHSATPVISVTSKLIIAEWLIWRLPWTIFPWPARKTQSWAQ